ncbi:hypothetical protein [Streptomyces chattanoogensis]|nr:hypothetical protein [Streptomyces chattanoogensis]
MTTHFGRRQAAADTDYLDYAPALAVLTSSTQQITVAHDALRTAVAA